MELNSYYQKALSITFSFAKHINCLNFFKQQDEFIDLPQVIGFKAHQQR